MMSCYLFSPDGHVLVTRRALTAAPWPALWMASWCAPATDLPLDAGLRLDLGVTVSDAHLIHPDFPYDTTRSGAARTGPVYAAITRDLPRPNPRTIMDWHWLTRTRLLELARAAPWTMCPWSADQILGLLAEPRTTPTTSRNRSPLVQPAVLSNT